MPTEKHEVKMNHPLLGRHSQTRIFAMKKFILDNMGNDWKVALCLKNITYLYCLFTCNKEKKIGFCQFFYHLWINAIDAYEYIVYIASTFCFSAIKYMCMNI